MRVARRLLWSTLLLLSQVACATSNWSQPIGEFKRNVDGSVAVVATYYGSLNEFERHLYLENAMADPDVRIATKDETGKPTPLGGQVFSARSIKARMDALALVSLYARRLADLAGTEAPRNFATNSKVLGENLSSLADTFKGLANGDGGAPDNRAKAYIGPIATLIGLVGEIYLEQRRDAALEKAISQGAPVVNDILIALEDDLAAVVDPLQRTGHEQTLAQLVVDYNANRATWPEGRRRQQLTAIEQASLRLDTALVFNPSNVLSGLRGAHDALVEYARSPRKPNDLATLADALSVFADRVETAAGAVRALRAAR